MKQQKIKKSEKKRILLNKSLLFFILSITCIPSQIIAQDNAIQDFNFEDANNIYKNGFYEKAYDNFNKYLKSTKQLSASDITKIKIKIAHCAFELGHYRKARSILRKICLIPEPPSNFQENHIIPSKYKIKSFVEILTEPPYHKLKSISQIYPVEFSTYDLSTKKEIAEFLNNQQNNLRTRKMLTQYYRDRYPWKNKQIQEFPRKNFKEKEEKLLYRMMLEDLYPIISYRNNNIYENLEFKDQIADKSQAYYIAKYWLARIDFENGKFFYAFKTFEEVLTGIAFSNKTIKISTNFYKALAYYHMGQYRKSLEDLETIAYLYKSDEIFKKDYFEQTYLYLGKALYKLSKFEKASIKLKTITAGYNNRDPQNKTIREAYFWLAETNYCKGLFQDAIKAYEVILNYGTYSEKEEAYYNIAWAFYKRGDHKGKQKAHHYFTQLGKEFPDSKYLLKAKLKIAEIEIENNRSDKAEKIINNVIQDPVNKNYFKKNKNFLKKAEYVIGLSFINQKDYSKAIKHFESASLTTDPKLKQKVLLEIGRSFKNLKKYSKAIHYLERAQNIFGSTESKVLAESLCADCYYEKEKSGFDLEIAIKSYKSLIERHPNHTHSTKWRMTLANAYRKRNETDKAIIILSSILKEDYSAWEKAQMDIGNIYLNTTPPRHKDAAAHFKKIISELKSKDKKEEAQLKYGISLYYSKSNVKAIQELKLLLDDTKTEKILTIAYEYIALSYIEEDLIEQAIETYETSLKKFPKQSSKIKIREHCSKLYHKIRNQEKAIEHQQAILNESKKKEKRSKAFLTLIDYDLRNKHYKKAETKLKELMTDYSDQEEAPEAAYKLGNLLLNQNRKEEAIKTFQKIIKDYPHPKFKFLSQIQLGHHFYSKKNHKEAIKYYESIRPSKQEISKIMKLYSKYEEQFLKNLSDSLFQEKEYERAVDQYSKLCLKFTKSKDVQFYRMRYSKSCYESGKYISGAISILKGIESKEAKELIEKMKIKRKKQSIDK